MKMWRSIGGVHVGVGGRRGRIVGRGAFVVGENRLEPGDLEEDVGCLAGGGALSASLLGGLNASGLERDVEFGVNGRVEDVGECVGRGGEVGNGGGADATRDAEIESIEALLDVG